MDINPVNRKDKAKSKYKDNPLTESEYLAENVFEGSGFSIQSWGCSPSFTRKRKPRIKKNDTDWDTT